MYYHKDNQSVDLLDEVIVLLSVSICTANWLLIIIVITVAVIEGSFLYIFITKVGIEFSLPSICRDETPSLLHIRI